MRCLAREGRGKRREAGHGIGQAGLAKRGRQKAEHHEACEKRYAALEVHRSIFAAVIEEGSCVCSCEVARQRMCQQENTHHDVFGGSPSIYLHAEAAIEKVKMTTAVGGRE